MNRAHWGTFDACLSSPTLPAIRAGAANRMACHRGKFQGMTASTGPRGCQAAYAPSAPTAAASAGSSARNDSACSAKYRQALAHFRTSALAATRVFPISVVMMVAMRSTSDSRISAARTIQPARSANVVFRYVANLDAARARMRSTSVSEISSKVFSTAPVAGLVVAMGMGHLGADTDTGPPAWHAPRGVRARPLDAVGRAGFVA